MLCKIRCHTTITTIRLDLLRFTCLAQDLVGSRADMSLHCNISFIPHYRTKTFSFCTVYGKR